MIVRRDPRWFTRYVFEFSLYDLEMNRRGQLSRRQKKRLWIRAEMQRVFAWFVAISIVSVGVFVENGWADDLSKPILLLGGFAIIGTAFACIYLLHPVALKEDIRSGTALATSGAVFIRPDGFNRIITVGGVELTMSKQVLAHYLLRSGSYWRVYYAPITKQVLSVEPMLDD